MGRFVLRGNALGWLCRFSDVGRYLLTRLGHALIVIFAVLFIVFFLSRVSGDPAALLMPPQASRAELEQFYKDIGYDRPLPIQFMTFLEKLAQGDLGVTLRTKEPVLPYVLAHLPATLQLAGAALLISLVVAFPIGVYGGTHPYSGGDRVVLVVTVIGQSMPVFWLGLMAIELFGVQLRLLPVGGSGTLAQLIMPAVTLSLYSTSRNARLIRSSVRDALTSEYVRTARAKGLAERSVVWRHGLRNALIPVVTLLGLQVGSLVGGVVVTETVFSWPGVGRTIVEGLTYHDFPLVQASVLFLAVVFTSVNLMVDLAYAAIDPRIRLTR